MKTPIRCLAKTLAIEIDGALRGKFYCRVPESHAPEDVADRAYFGDEQARQKLREGDIIEVEPEDMSWSGELTVRALYPQAREVKTVWRSGPVYYDQDISNSTKNKLGDQLFRLEYKGKNLRWCIFCGDERRESGFLTKETASTRMMALSGASELSEV